MTETITSALILMRWIDLKRPARAYHVSVSLYCSLVYQIHGSIETVCIYLFRVFSFFFSITVPGGLTLREGIRIIDRVFESGRLRGMDLVEVCPKIGDAMDVKITIDSAIQLVNAATGNKRSGNSPLVQSDLPRN